MDIDFSNCNYIYNVLVLFFYFIVDFLIYMSIYWFCLWVDYENVKMWVLNFIYNFIWFIIVLLVK